jgi:hypothetical protein
VLVQPQVVVAQQGRVVCAQDLAIFGQRLGRGPGIVWGDSRRPVSRALHTPNKYRGAGLLRKMGFHDGPGSRGRATRAFKPFSSALELRVGFGYMYPVSPIQTALRRTL